MDDLEPTAKPDLALAGLAKQDLSDLSVDDLQERIENMRAEITRCEELITARGSTRAAADALFKS